MNTNASAAADRNTNALTIMVEPSPPNMPLMNSNTASMSDPEVAHLVHDNVAHQHPRYREAEPPFGNVELYDRPIVIGRHHIEQQEHRDRKSGQEYRRELSFGRERLDLAPHLEALADHGRKVGKDLAQIAAGRALNGDRRDEQRKVLLADAEVEVAHR